MVYSPKAVANHFIDLARESNQSLDPMKMQKLVFFGHGWHLGLNDQPLIGEPIEAWDYGPVVKSLYRDLKHYGAGQITAYVTDLESGPSTGSLKIRLIAPKVTDDPTRAFLRRIWAVYGKMSGPELSALTHRPETPWSVTWRSGCRGLPIPDSLMREYFANLARQNAAARTAAG